MKILGNIKEAFSMTEDIMNKKISENIKNVRTNHDMTQSTLSELLGVNNRQTLSNWEKGKSVPIFELVKISKLFGVTLNELIFGEIKLKSVTADDYIVNLAKKIRTTLNKENTNTGQFWGDMLLPIVGPDNILKYWIFKQGYAINMESFNNGDSSMIFEALDRYQIAFDNGLTEAAANILKIIVSFLLANNTNLHDNEGDKVKEKLEYYVRSLEEIENPIGEYYRAILLIYGLVKTDKVEEERVKEGLSLMAKLSGDGNELASQYLKYIESSAKED